MVSALTAVLSGSMQSDIASCVQHMGPINAAWQPLMYIPSGLPLSESATARNVPCLLTGGLLACAWMWFAAAGANGDARACSLFVRHVHLWVSALNLDLKN